MNGRVGPMHTSKPAHTRGAVRMAGRAGSIHAEGPARTRGAVRMPIAAELELRGPGELMFAFLSVSHSPLFSDYLTSRGFFYCLYVNNCAKHNKS